MARKTCGFCKRKREEKYMKEIPFEVSKAALMDNVWVCEKVVKWRNDADCLEKALKNAARIKHKEMSLISSVLTEVKTSNQDGRKNLAYDLYSLIEDIENENKGL